MTPGRKAILKENRAAQKAYPPRVHVNRVQPSPAELRRKRQIEQGRLTTSNGLVRA